MAGAHLVNISLEGLRFHHSTTLGGLQPTRIGTSSSTNASGAGVFLVNSGYICGIVRSVWQQRKEGQTNWCNWNIYIYIYVYIYIYIYILCNVFVGWELCKAALLEVVVAELWSFYCSVVLTWGVSSLDIGTLMGEWHTAILLILHPKTLISMLHLHNVGREEPIVIGVYRNMCVNICISIYIEYTKWKCYGTAPFKTTGKPSSFFWYLFGQERTKKKKRKEPLKMWSKIGRTSASKLPSQETGSG